MMDREKLQEAVDKKWEPIYATSRGDVIEYFQETYGANWKSHAAAARAGTTDKKSRAYKSASRQFQMDNRTGQERYKGEKLTKATRAKYAEIGKTLPPIGKKLTGDRLTLTVTGNQYDKKGSRDRQWTATFKGANAYAFANDPS